MGRIRILVADGHRIFAEALATALAAEPEVDVAAAGSAAGADRALERALAENRPFHVLLVDAGLGPGAPGAPPAALTPPAPALAHVPPQRRGSPPAPPQPGRTVPQDALALIGQARAAQPALRAVVLSTAEDPAAVVRALQAGANAWVVKESSLTRLMTVVRGVLKDETHVPPALLTGVIQELTAARRDRSESERLVESLTPREQQVLRCMVAGLGRQAVADRLYLSPHTVRTHMQNVLGKLGVHSTLAAVAVARRAGVGPLDLTGSEP